MNNRSKRRSVVSRHTKKFLRRMAERKGISYEKAVVKFYGKQIKSLDKQLAICLGVYIEVPGENKESVREQTLPH